MTLDNTTEADAVTREKKLAAQTGYPLCLFVLRAVGKSLAVNEHTLISKLSFAVFGDASAQSLQQLEKILLEAAPHFAKGRSENPGNKQISEWMRGRPIRKIGHYLFFQFVIENYVRQPQIYDSLTADQKKVFSQAHRFLTRRISSFDIADIGPNITRRASKTRWLEIKLVYDAVAENLSSAREELQDERPNHPDSAAAVEKSLEIIDMVEDQLKRIDTVVVSSLKLDDADDQEVQSVVKQVAEEFRAWIVENKPEVVDAVMRLTPATAFLGMLGLAGANMTWATPIVLAICGGKSVVDVVKSIKN